MKEETSDTTTSPSNSTPLSSSQSASTLQLINGQGQLKVLQATLNNISAWLEALGSKSKPKKPFSMGQLLSSQGSQKKVEGFLVELERYKLTAGLVLSQAIRYAHETTEQ